MDLDKEKNGCGCGEVAASGGAGGDAGRDCTTSTTGTTSSAGAGCSIYEQRAVIFKALCDEKRQRIIELIGGGEKCACCLTELTGIPQSSLSYHMKILCDSGIVQPFERGKWTHYKLNPAGCERAKAELELILAGGEDAE